MKSSLSDLAIFNGSPAFEDKLHIGRPNVGNREHLLKRISNSLDQRWLTNNGPYVQEFEHRLEELLDVKHVIAICNATVALEIAIKALDLKGEVIVPSFTFIATAHALQWQGVTPVFCDVNSHTHNIDPLEVERHITPRTTGIIGVHLWGQACDIEALQEITDRNGFKLLFDAAHAFKSTYMGKNIGRFGAAEVFSFHATKFINTFEGGAIATNDDDLAKRIRLMKNFGFSGYDQVVCLGTNGKMSEISAAMGLTGLESLEQIISVNKQNYQKYCQNLANIPGVCLKAYPPGEQYNYQYIVLEIIPIEGGLNRDDLVEILHAENVLARRYFYPGCHQMEPYRSLFPNAGLNLPVTEHLAEQVMVLPTGTAVNENDISVVCEIIRFCLVNSIQIKNKLNLLSR